MAKKIPQATNGPGDVDENQQLISFTVPTWVIEGREMSPAAFGQWIRAAAAQYRYGRGEISIETAAAHAGISQAEFMRVLKDANQDTVVIDWDDFDRELAELARHRPAGTDG